MSTPVTKEFLEKALGRPLDRFEASEGSSLGDGYTCAMYKSTAWITGEEHPVHVVVKCFPENASRQQFLDEGSLFVIELRFYDSIIPELEAFQEEHLPPAQRIPLPFAPFISGNYTALEERKQLSGPFQGLDNYLVLPDMRTPNNGSFQIRDRFLGFDLDHQNLVMEGQARLHALSWAYNQKRGMSLLERFPVLDTKSFSEVFKAFLPETDENLKKCAKLFPNNSRFVEALEHLRKVYEPIFEFYFDVDMGHEGKGQTKDTVTRVLGDVVEDEKPWNALLHGDCWSNNLLFRYDQKTGRPVEVLFIDLQISRVGDPMTDLVYTLYINPEPHLRRKHLTSLLWVYYDTFSAICELLDVPSFPGWSYPELTRRVRRASILGGAMGPDLTIMLKKPSTMEEIDRAVGKSSKDEGTGNNGDSKDGIQEMVNYFTDLVTVEDLHPALLPRLTGIFEDLVLDGVL